MITIEMPEPAEQELELAPRFDALRAEALPEEAGRPLLGRLSLGGPVYRKIRADSTDDAELKNFINDTAAQSDFFLLHLTATLQSLDEEPFTEAMVEIDLTAADEHAPLPIAWSMEPYRLFEPVEIARTVSLGPSLKIQGFGIDARAERTQTRERKEVLVAAMRELESTPCWELYRTSSTPLHGLHRFHLVVRTRKGTLTKGTMTIEAKVERKRFGVIPYEASFPGRPSPVSFVLDDNGR